MGEFIISYDEVGRSFDISDAYERETTHTKLSITILANDAHLAWHLAYIGQDLILTRWVTVAADDFRVDNDSCHWLRAPLSGQATEMCLMFTTPETESVIVRLVEADRSIIRFVGEQGIRDLILNEADKDSMQRVLGLYRQLKTISG